MTCPYCPGVALLRLGSQGQRTLPWRGCPCCGCSWRLPLDPANQVHPLAWVPACSHPVAV